MYRTVAVILGQLSAAAAGFLLGETLPEPYGPLLTYGPLGIFVVLWLTSRIASKAELDRANARADRAEQQRDELAARMVSDLVPLVSEVQRTMLPAFRNLTERVERMDSRLDQLLR